LGHEADLGGPAKRLAGALAARRLGRLGHQGMILPGREMGSWGPAGW
jgi:hypothetical protein